MNGTEATQRRTYLVALVVAVALLAVATGLAAVLAFGGDGGDGPGFRGDRLDRRGWHGMPRPSVAIDARRAQVIADDWLAANEPGATAGAPALTRMGYVFHVAQDSRVVGVLVVDATTGSVRYRAAPTAAPTPTPTGDRT